MDEKKIIYTNNVHEFKMQYPDVYLEIKKIISNEYNAEVKNKRIDYIAKRQLGV